MGDAKGLNQYNKNLVAAITAGGSVVENVMNPLFPHRGRICYSKAAAVVPERDGLVLAFQVTWDYYDDKEARRRYEVRIGKLQEEWEPVENALDGDAAVPMALLDPLLDAIQGQLDARAADVERDGGQWSCGS